VPLVTSPSRFTNIPTPGSSGLVPVVNKNSFGEGDATFGLSRWCGAGTELFGGGGGAGEEARDPGAGEAGDLRPPMTACFCEAVEDTVGEVGEVDAGVPDSGVVDK